MHLREGLFLLQHTVISVQRAQIITQPCPLGCKGEFMRFPGLCEGEIDLPCLRRIRLQFCQPV